MVFEVARWWCFQPELHEMRRLLGGESIIRDEEFVLLSWSNWCHRLISLFAILTSLYFVFQALLWWQG